MVNDSLDLRDVSSRDSMSHMMLIARAEEAFSVEFTGDAIAPDGLKWLDLGAGAGAGDDGADGLRRFKCGWTNTTRMAYLCGRIFDRAKYRRLAEGKGVRDYFPAHRKGEFV
jgi:hypothetical protein